MSFWLVDRYLPGLAVSATWMPFWTLALFLLHRNLKRHMTSETDRQTATLTAGRSCSHGTEEEATMTETPAPPPQRRSLYAHVPHPHLKHRAEAGAPTVGQAVAEHPSFNMRLAAWGTTKFGSMPAFYAFVIYGALGAVFTAYQVTLLYWSNWVQLWSLPLLAVGSAVLGVALNKMMKRQFDDVELLVHDLDQTAQHLAAQDDKILAILAAIEANTGLTEQVKAALTTGAAPAPEGGAS